MNDIVLETLESLRTEIQALGVKVSHELTFDLPTVTGNKSQLREVVLNLINNALEAMDGAEIRTRRLEVATRRDDADAIVVAVKDTGGGIAANHPNLRCSSLSGLALIDIAITPMTQLLRLRGGG
jgi:C4-dicarboxylate-specific signal transduction histidine kinase